MSGPAGTGEAEELRLTRALAGQLLVGSLRLGLGFLGLVAATLRGLQGDRALAAFALGALGFVVAIMSADRYFVANEEPTPVPPRATVDSLRATLRAAIWPSTVGVAVLLAIALTQDATLAALLAGVLAGMGLAALLTAAQIAASERAAGGRLLVDRKRREVYVARDGG
jgi:hypothetical protein